MRLEQSYKMAHPIIYPSMRRGMVDSLLVRGLEWMCIDHIPWDQNPLVIFEKEILNNGNIRRNRPRAHEWRHKGKIYHRDVLNNVWQKKDGKMLWIGIYDPHNDSFNTSVTEPK